jgi:hypothetical protein
MLAPEQNMRSCAEVTISAAHLGVLEAHPLDGVGQLDVHAEIVGVELEQVFAAADRLFQLHVHRQGGDRPIEVELPVGVALGVGVQGEFGRGFGVGVIGHVREVTDPPLGCKQYSA